MYMESLCAKFNSELKILQLTNIVVKRNDSNSEGVLLKVCKLARGPLVWRSSGILHNYRHGLN